MWAYVGWPVSDVVALPHLHALLLHPMPLPMADHQNLIHGMYPQTSSILCTAPVWIHAVSPRPGPEAGPDFVMTATAAHSSVPSCWAVLRKSLLLLLLYWVSIVPARLVIRTSESTATDRSSALDTPCTRLGWIDLTWMVIADSPDLSLQLRGSCAVASATMPGGSKWPAAPGRLTAGQGLSWP